MNRRSRHRIWKIEELLSAARQEREEKQKKKYDNYLFDARFHATAVAAIVLSGEPKIDEPLIRAWTRALQHNGIGCVQQYGMNLEETVRIRDQVAAAQQLFPRIMTGEKEAAKFTEIFKTAPPWLLDFTGTLFDTVVLKFDLPHLKFDLPHKPCRAKWGSAGYEEWCRWPLLPLGMMTDGDPLSDEEARLWPVQWKMKKVDPVPAFDSNCSQADEDSPSPEDELIEDAELCMEVAANRGRAKELSRYEKVRLRNLFKYFSSQRQRSGTRRFRRRPVST